MSRLRMDAPTEKRLKPGGRHRQALPPETLSPRELQILKLLALGHTDVTVAKTLKGNLHTVRHHIKSLMAKWDVHTRAHAIAEGYDRGYLGGKQ